MTLSAICVHGKLPYETVITIADSFKCKAFVSIDGEDQVMFSDSKDFKTSDIAAQIKVMFPSLIVEYNATSLSWPMLIETANKIMANLPKTNGG